MTAASGMRRSWLDFARHVVEYAARRADPTAVPVPTELEQTHSGVFVTLQRHRRLRGCMGTLDATLPLAEAIRQAAVNATVGDPRFQPVGVGELPDIELEVSILSPPVPMNTLEDLELGRHGVIVQRGARRGLFLPQVATSHRFDKETFIERCCTEKAGLPPGAWRDPDTEVLLFTAEVFRESD